MNPPLTGMDRSSHWANVPSVVLITQVIFPEGDLKARSLASAILAHTSVNVSVVDKRMGTSRSTGLLRLPLRRRHSLSRITAHSAWEGPPPRPVPKPSDPTLSILHSCGYAARSDHPGSHAAARVPPTMVRQRRRSCPAAHAPRPLGQGGPELSTSRKKQVAGASKGRMSRSSWKF